ncbi:uncharacterized protein RHO25_005625 [Cercospora beticola]|uniref:Tautomerase cis-CaaD-like domain-containing protein n=1 Tax=Cercospora beticola TaxID=122368 RepID=A0ABZ0NNF1_CERBT|nr:hypothetical protein RHO25_005625 [Cercospora beticola]CAK1360730.1 unnamed protein product [Cercospora beticola]
MPSTISHIIDDPTATYHVIHFQVLNDPSQPDFRIAFYHLIGNHMQNFYHISEKDPFKAAADGLTISRDWIWDDLMQYLTDNPAKVAVKRVRLYLVKLSIPETNEAHRIFWIAGRPGVTEGDDKFQECGFAIDPDYVGRGTLQSHPLAAWDWDFLFQSYEGVKPWVQRWERDKTCPREVDPWVWDG